MVVLTGLWIHQAILRTILPAAAMVASMVLRENKEAKMRWYTFTSGVLFTVVLVIGQPLGDHSSVHAATYAQFVQIGPITDTNGTPINGARVYHYAPGTLVLKNVWTDRAKTTPAPQPVVADSRGNATFYADGLYKLVITDASDVTIYTWDNFMVLDPTVGATFDLLSNRGYTKAGLPAAARAGRVARVTDDVRGLWMDTGSQWFSQANEILNAKEFGAKGDGKVANDCSMTSGSTSLTCATGRFVSSDVGKPIVVYEAGPTNGGFVQPLTSTIQTYTSPTSVTLANAASATVTPSSRTLWGTDDTSALQAAVDALAASDGNRGNKGGILNIPRGMGHGDVQ